MGQFVRLLGKKATFHRGYDIHWTEQIYKVHAILKTEPVTYRVSDIKDEVVQGAFYENELQKKRILIEKVLKRRVRNVNGKSVREALVRWLGYPDEKFDEWIEEKQVKDLLINKK